ncbi:DUF262 domain-containing protein [Candidatus Woesearchaeota archaeon]|nr:DUF262 domain-containing protein [Candidatus Woesearchaeota archaeon]
MVKKFDSKTYYINDFKEWDERKELTLAPYFQRRTVWSDKARSYLIDTILRGSPIPPIYMRHHIDPQTKKSVREIVDGQQRLRTILNYLQDGFKVLKTHNEIYGGLYFSKLPRGVQDEFLAYELSADLLLGTKDEEVLDIFARLNTYTVKLNKQELLNAKYFGLFKKSVYSLGYEFVNFWTTNNILNLRQISRMAEAEFTTDIVIAMISGIQSKNVADAYYKKYDDSFPMMNKVITEFKKCMDAIGEIFNGNLANSIFNSKTLFYSFFCAIYDLSYGLPNSKFSVEKKLSPSMYPKIRAAIDQIESILESPSDYVKYNKFIVACDRHTTNITERQLRHKVIMDILLKNIGN